MRSIKLLNNYLDNLSQNKGVSEQKLKFYIAEKSNKKSRKYYFFDINLEGLKDNVTNNILNHHIDKLIEIFKFIIYKY